MRPAGRAARGLAPAAAFIFLVTAGSACTGGAAPAPPARPAASYGAPATALAAGLAIAVTEPATAPAAGPATAVAEPAATAAPDSVCPTGGAAMRPDPFEMLNQLLSQPPPNAADAGARACTLFSSSSSSGGASVAITTTSDQGGTASATVTVTDVHGSGMAGVTVNGSVRVTVDGQTRTLSFPPTDAAGRTSVTVQSPRGRATTLLWTVQVTLGGSTSTMTARTDVP